MLSFGSGSTQALCRVFRDLSIWQKHQQIGEQTSSAPGPPEPIKRAYIKLVLFLTVEDSLQLAAGSSILEANKNVISAVFAGKFLHEAHEGLDRLQ
jgi:hypothetical protein